MDLGSDITDLGGAVGSLFTSEGNAAQAKDFQGAATLATQNAQLAAASTKIQATQTARSVAQSLGTTQADVAGAGFTTSGSGLAILKASASQGALAKSLVNIQGAINENSYAAQAGAYSGEATAAKEASTAGTIGAIGAIGGALVSGTGNLISAGKTVASGANYVSNLFSGNNAPTGVDAINDAELGEDPDEVLNAITDEGLESETDSAITSTLDTSSSTFLGQGVDAVSGAVSDAFDSVSSALSSVGDSIASELGVDAIPGVGEVTMAAQLLDLIPGFKNIPLVGPLVNGVVSGVNDVVDGVVSVVGDIGSAIGSVFGSVICTALYKRGMLTRQVWFGAQKYGRDVAPEHIYLAYLLWGKPIADAISKHAWFAKLAAPVFVPWAHELAVLAGEKTAISTFFGRVVFKTTYAFSSVLGKVLYRRNHVTS